MSGADQTRRRTQEELERELAEAREQQAVTAEILAAISSPPANPRDVFEKIAASATRLCDAYDATILQVDGDCLRIVAHHGPIPTFPVGDSTLPLVRELATAHAVLDRRTIHVADLQAETAQYPESSDRARRLGFRTTLAVPLGKSARRRVRPLRDQALQPDAAATPHSRSPRRQAVRALGRVCGSA